MSQYVDQGAFVFNLAHGNDSLDSLGESWCRYRGGIGIIGGNSSRLDSESDAKDRSLQAMKARTWSYPGWVGSGLLHTAQPETA